MLFNNKHVGEIYWDYFCITKSQPVGPIYLRIANHQLKNDLPMQLLLTIVPKGIFVHHVLKEIYQYLLPLYDPCMYYQFQNLVHL